MKWQESNMFYVTQFCTCNFSLHNSGIVHCLGIFMWPINNMLLQNIHVYSVTVRDLLLYCFGHRLVCTYSFKYWTYPYSCTRELQSYRWWVLLQPEQPEQPG